MKTRIHAMMVAVLVGGIGLAWPVAQAQAQVPSLLNYQGRVAVGGTNFDGTGQFKFALVNGGGSATYWSNGVNAVTCTVTKGLYAILLGDTTISDMAALPATVFTNSDVRLRVWFAPQGSVLQLLSPDQRVAAAGYALNADQVDGLNSTAFAQTSSSPTFTGTVTAAAFSGNGAGVTNVNADRVDGLHGTNLAQLSSSPAFTGTVTAPGFSGDGAGVTNVNADRVDGLHSSAFAQLSSSPTFTGTVTAAAFSGSGAAVTGVNADELDGSHGSAFAHLASSPTFTGTVTAAAFAGSGAGITGVNADELDGQHGAYYRNAANLTGTLNNVQLSTNAALLNAVQTFSKDNHFSANVGIGTTNPTKRLEVRAPSTADGIRLDGSGGVAPAFSLSTNDALCAELALASGSGQYSSDAAGGDVILRNSIGKVLIQHSSGSSAICVSTGNLVGIHKSNPATPLDVNGAVTATSFSGGGAGLTGVNGGAVTNLSLLQVKGKTLIVGQNWGDGPFRVYGSTWTVDQSNLAYNDNYYWWDLWQSFTAGTNGTLAAVEVWICAQTGGPWSATLSIYTGEGATGAVLSSQSVGGDGANQGRVLTLETPVLLTLSNQYTFRIHDSSAELQIHLSHNNYAGGRFSYSTNYDADFYTYMIQTSEVPALVIQPNTLNVGIGTANPTNKLQVAGHVQCTSVIQTSDRNAKENIEPASPDEILAGVSALPIATWNFKNDNSGPHLGPMAQDFRTAFGLGNTDSGICSVDADGVALAAIQGLNRKLDAALQAKDAQISALQSRVEQLEKTLNESKRPQSQ